MAETSATPAQADTPSGFNLQVVSPSASVSRPLVFPGIPASTTVRQLKEKIRDAVASRPGDDQQRLIHRGRLLARDDETLENVLGAEALRSGEQQTLHLVLREISDHHPGPSQTTPVRGHSPAPGTLPGAQQRAQQAPRPQQPPLIHHPHQHIHAGHAYPPGNRPLTAPIIQMPPFIGMPPMPFQYNGPFHPPGAADPTVHEQLANEAHRMMANIMNPNPQQAATPVGGARASSNPPPHGRVPTQTASRLTQHLAQHAQQQEALANHAEQITNLLNNPVTNQPNRPAASQQFANQAAHPLHHGQRLMAQQLVDQGQRERAAAGLHGVQDNGPANLQGQAWNMSGRNSPVVGQPVNVTREVVTQNGNVIRWTTTVNGQVNGHTVHIPNVNTPIQPIAPGVTTSVFQIPSRQGSRTATPDPSQRAQNAGSGSVPTSAQPAARSQPSQEQPEVYIAMSPTGPQALLLTNSGAYYSPQVMQQAAMYPPLPSFYDPRGYLAPGRNPTSLRERSVRQRRRAQNQPQQGGAQPPAANNQVNQAIDLHQHRGPPNVGAAAVLAAMWPHVWLLVRLAAFVWWFTATDSSWSRWVTVVLIAIGVFAVNTGLFNNIAHQAWDPFRRHLEGLLLPGARVMPPPPPAPPNNADRQEGGDAAAAAPDPNRRGPVPQPAGGQPHQQQQQQPARHNPNPAETAARLVARRQQHNANWVMDQIRRVERAGLLFLASIAPGVAERHIAHLEAQEREAAQGRARREAEAAAEAARAQSGAQAQAEGRAGAAAEGTGGGEEEGLPEGREPAQGQEGPLIEV